MKKMKDSEGKKHEKSESKAVESKEPKDRGDKKMPKSKTKGKY
jgi:hypothetical protein